MIHVAAERFTFTPSDITVDEGSRGGAAPDERRHRSWVSRRTDSGDPNVLIPKRGRGDVRVTIDAKAPGDYPFECSHVCGAGHGFMRGVDPREAAIGCEVTGWRAVNVVDVVIGAVSCLLMSSCCNRRRRR